MFLKVFEVSSNIWVRAPPLRTTSGVEPIFFQDSIITCYHRAIKNCPKTGRFCAKLFLNCEKLDFFSQNTKDSFVAGAS